MTLGEFREKTKDLPDELEINISTGSVVAQTTACIKDDLDNIEKYYEAQFWSIDSAFDSEDDSILLFVDECIMY